MADKFQLLLKQQELLIKGKEIEKYPKPTYKSYEEIKQENSRLKQIKKYQRTLLLHSLMPRELRKTGEKPQATMGLHQIDVGLKVRDVLTRFKSESRCRKKEKAIRKINALVGKKADGMEPEVPESDLIVHTHEDED